MCMKVCQSYPILMGLCQFCYPPATVDGVVVVEIIFTIIVKTFHTGCYVASIAIVNALLIALFSHSMNSNNKWFDVRFRYGFLPNINESRFKLYYNSIVIQWGTCSWVRLFDMYMYYMNSIFEHF